MERLRHNVALIEARDREARLQLESPGTGTAPHFEGVTREQPFDRRRAHNEARKTEPEERGPLESRKKQNGHHRSSAEAENGVKGREDPWVPRPASEEPESWKPKMVLRGG